MNIFAPWYVSMSSGMYEEGKNYASYQDSNSDSPQRHHCVTRILLKMLSDDGLVNRKILCTLCLPLHPWPNEPLLLGTCDS